MRNYFTKTDRRILNIAMALLLMMLYLLYDDSLILPSDEENLSGVAKIFNAKNDVRRKSSKRYVWRSARKSDTLHYGDSVFVGPKSQVTLEFSDGRNITLQENSLIVISSVKNQLHLDLKFGHVSGSLAEGSTLTVNGRPITIKDEIVSLEAEAAPVVINHLDWVHAPPSRLVHQDRQVPLDLSWESTQPSKQYRLQISADTNFKKPVYQQSITKKKIKTFEYPNQGKFFVRIEARDTSSKTLLYTPAVQVEIIDKTPPAITFPQNRQVFTFTTNDTGGFDEPPFIPIQWSYDKKSTEFEIQISDFEDFSVVLKSIAAKEKRVMNSALKPGIFFARVRDSNVGPEVEPTWSPVVSFRVNHLSNRLKAPKLLTKRINFSAPSAENISIAWTPTEEAAQYVVEVSNNSNFDTKQTFSTKETKFNYGNFNAGKSYFRVFASTKKGNLGEPSDTGELSVKVKRPILAAVEPRSIMGKSPEDPGDPQDFDLSWSDLKIVDSYTVEVSKDPQFRRGQRYPAAVSKTKITVPEPGQYYVRVKGLDKNGNAISRYSDPQPITYNFRVPMSTPQLIEPLNQMTLYFQKNSSPYIWLEWKGVRQARTYNVEISRDANFTQKILAVVTTSNRYLVQQTLPQGLLFWRIQALGDADQISNWSPPRQMTVFSGKASSSRLPASRRR